MSKFLKPILVCFTATILLSACSFTTEISSTNDTPSDSDKVIYDSTTFSMQIPKDWEILEGADLGEDAPPEMVVAFTSNIKKDFVANINVIELVLEEEAEEITLAEFAGENKKNMIPEMLEFKDLGDKAVKLNSAQGTVDGIILQFEGKSDPASDLTEFKQLYVINNDSAYIITGTFSRDEDQAVKKQIEDILTSLTLK